MLKDQNNNQKLKTCIRNEILKKRRSVGIYNFYKSHNIMRQFLNYFAINSEDIIGVYWPINYEIDTRPLISYLIRKKIKICLPIIENKAMSFKLWMPHEKLHYSKLKFYSPSSNSQTITPNIIVTPALAVDQEGNRIGYGKGYYDKYYKNNKSSLYIGYVYEEQILKKLPFDKHDLKLNAIVSDNFVKIIDKEIL